MSVGQRVIRASLIVGLAHALFKIASLLQVMVLGRFVDRGTYDVVYAFAFEGCIFSVYLLGEEVIGPTFLPVFMEELDKRGEKTAWHFANTLLTFQFLLLLAVIATIMSFPEAITLFITRWSPTADPARFELAVRGLFWTAPSLLCLSLGSTTYMVLNGYRRFFLAAFGDAAWKFCVLVAVFGGIGLLGGDYRWILVGLLGGSVAKLLTHVIGLWRELPHLRPTFAWRNPALRTMLLLMLPLVCGIVLAKVRDVFNNVTILSALGAEGLLQANSFGRKLPGTIGVLVPYAISIAMFPFLCELVDKDDRDAFGRLLTRSGRLLLAVFIPLALVGAVLAEPVSSLLFLGGKFTREAVTWTAISTACYLLVLPAQGLEFFLMQAFFAKRKMLSITLIGILFSAFSIGVSYLGIRVMGARGASALVVVALGFAASRTLKSLTLVGVLKRSVPCFPAAETLGFLLRTFLTAVVAAACALGTTRLLRCMLVPSDAKGFLLLELTLAGAAALAGYCVTAWLTRLQEPGAMVHWAIARIRERKYRTISVAGGAHPGS